MCAWFVLKCSFLEISSTSHDKNYSKTFSNISSTAPLRKRILKSRPQNYANEPHVVAVAHLLRAACDTTDTVTFQSTRLPVPVQWRIVQWAEILVMSKLLQILSFICCSFAKFPFFPWSLMCLVTDLNDLNVILQVLFCRHLSLVSVRS